MKRNSSKTPKSASFMKLYNSLPPEARQSLVENKLAPLLDSVPKERAKKVMKSASTLHSRYSDIPVLDLKAKKKEVNFLMDELSRDSRRAVVRERSHREELLVEIVDSMVNWLNDIWTVVYEYNVLFVEAHECLLFVADVLNTLNTLPGIVGHCRCFSHIRVAFSIKRKGNTIKKFNLAGPRHIDQALLWIWRDLFLSMFVKGKLTERIPQMLSDIEECMGWTALERLLYGGSRRLSSLDEYDEDDYDDDECESGGFNEEDTCIDDESSVEDDEDDSEDEDDDDDDDDDDESSYPCDCPLHASHWSVAIDERRGELRDLVHEHLISLFELTPAHQLFISIISISPHSQDTEMQLLNSLSEIAGSSADTLVAALNIHCGEGRPGPLMSLLDEHAHLLRPRDAPVLQRVVSFLTQFSAYQARALQFAEKEMLSTLAGVRAGIRTAFSRIEDKALLQVLAEIAKLRSDSLGRHQRVGAWVDSVLTPESTAAHPMALAAMLMGFPLPAGMDDGDDMDVLGFLDSDLKDPDLEDLREEFRPKLRERFDGWLDLLKTLKGGSGVLGRVYIKTMEDMPYFKVKDVADEMLARLGERPSKAYISEAVDSVLTFAKSQRKKMAARTEKRLKNEAAKKAAATAAASPSAPPPPPAPLELPPHIAQHTSGPFTFLTTSHPLGPSSSSSIPGGGVGGMEDVD